MATAKSILNQFMQKSPCSEAPVFTILGGGPQTPFTCTLALPEIPATWKAHGAPAQAFTGTGSNKKVSR